MDTRVKPGYDVVGGWDAGRGGERRGLLASNR